MDKLKRCAWVPSNDFLYQEYHDNEWGVPVHDDRKLFEMLILEGIQAGLSWRTVLKKRDSYKRLFYDFNVEKCSKMTDTELEKLLLNPEIIRNRLKVFSIRKNALVFIEIQKEFGSFNDYIWNFVDYKQIVNRFATIGEIQPKTELSENISKDLKKRGMSFVGSTIMYAYMQAVGLVNDHTVDCFRYNQISKTSD